ncbi:potassium channel protein [Salibacteraceae bacterium]|nr:potassium channel protein [Salibacteraceae bacterium]MDB9710037.1 potassium channel protein [Salibacteraceae bacterium]HAQ70877.1 potassium channel protein [Flavobacteriales bacterium]
MKLLLSFKYFKEIYYAIAFLMAVLFIGTVGYIYLEDYSWMDAFYMTVITVSTVGFGEIAPLHPVGKLFTSLLIITTFGTFAYVISMITRYLISGQYRIYYKTFQVNNQLEKLSNHVIICGYGRNGRQAVKTLQAHKVPFLVIESDLELVHKLREEDSNILVIDGDATDDSVIIKAGINRAIALITTLPRDTDNLFVVLTARDINKGLNIISRASDDRSEHKLRIAGANNVILPDKVGGAHMATLVTSPDLMQFLDQISMMGEDESTLVEIQFKNLPPDFEHKSILELEKRYQTGARIIGFKTPENKIIVNPSPETELVPKSKLFVLGNINQIIKIKQALHIDD